MGDLVWCNFFSKPLEPEAFFYIGICSSMRHERYFYSFSAGNFSQCISLQDIFFSRKQSVGYLFPKKKTLPPSL